MDSSHHLLPPMAASSASSSASEAPPPPSTTTTVKKPRRKAREVSSRYMATPSPSPLTTSSSSSSPLHSYQIQKHRRSPSVPSSPDATDSESEPNSRFSDENRPVNRSLDTPVFVGSHQNKILVSTQRRTVVRLFGENGGNFSRKPRPGTPMAACPVSTPKGAILTNAHSRTGRNNASKGFKSNSFRGKETCPENSSTFGDSELETAFCDSPPIQGSRVSRQVSEFRSSMPEADLLPSMSSRRVLDGASNRNNDGDDKFTSSSSSSICCRSLNLALSGCQNSKPAGRLIPSKICLPPQPPSSKLDAELKKGKKGLNKQEEIHMLRLLHNRYLQWRFVNAKERVAVDARTNAAEKSLYGLSTKISEMRNSVIEKRIDLERQTRSRRLSGILETQMPFLDQWLILEEDYSSSLTGVTKALHDAALRLPIAGNVRADIKDLREVFDSTMNIFKSLSPCVERFIPNAEAIDGVGSDLAEIVGIERGLIEECGNLLSEAHNLQVTECSLRSQLMQAKRSCEA